MSILKSKALLSGILAITVLFSACKIEGKTICSGKCVKAKDESRLQKKYLEYKDYQVYYEVRGNSGKTLVFIHGWSSGIDSWKFQLDAFPDYRVIAVDLPGHGKSSKNTDATYSMELYANTIHEILKEEKTENAFLIGHSMGFAIAEVVCYKYPEICAGIAGIDGAHFELPETLEEREAWIEYNRSMAASVEVKEGRDYFIGSLFLEDTPELLKKEVFAIVEEVPLVIGKKVINSMEDNLEFWEKRVVNKPCLAVHSPVFNLTGEYKNDFISMYPLAEYYLIENVSHFLMLEIPYKVNQIMSDYLEKVY